MMKYCKKHNQKYMDFLTDCPICIGETMVVAGSEREVIKKDILKGKKKLIKKKRRKTS